MYTFILKAIKILHYFLTKYTLTKATHSSRLKAETVVRTQLLFIELDIKEIFENVKQYESSYYFFLENIVIFLTKCYVTM